MISSIRPQYYLVLAIFCLLIAYSLYQARFIIIGPRIQVSNLSDGQVVNTPILEIEGEAKNVARISLNDRQIFTDAEGHWNEKLIVSPGMSIITLNAKDRFGREITKHLRIILN